LQGAGGALNPAFGLWSIGAYDVDVELMQSPPERGHAVAACCAHLVDPEGGVLVASGLTSGPVNDVLQPSQLWEVLIYLGRFTRVHDAT
jgi:hypothetical protein